MLAGLISPPMELSGCGLADGFDGGDAVAPVEDSGSGRRPQELKPVLQVPSRGWATFPLACTAASPCLLRRDKRVSAVRFSDRASNHGVLTDAPPGSTIITED